MDINNIKNYSKLLFNSGPVQTMDFINSKYDVIHNELYNSALDELIKNIGKQSYENITNNVPNYEEYIKEFVKDFKKTHKFIEIKKEEYFTPSDVIIINLEFPYERQKYNLKDYWNDTTEKRNNKDITLMQFNEDTVNYAELVYVDYVNGKCKFKSKLTGEEFWTTFDYINENTKISDELSLDNTFMYKLKKIETTKSE